MSKEAKLRTVKKKVARRIQRWPRVTAIRSKLCKKWESHIKVSMVTTTLGFEKVQNVQKKNTLKKHLESASHKKVADCEKRKNLGIEKYTEKVIHETPIEKGLKWMGSDDKKALH